MPELSDMEFIQICKECCDVLDMDDDEFIARHAELETAASANRNWDQQRFLCWWQDPARKPNLRSKRDVAGMLAVSLTTIDNWIRQGAPVYHSGSNGIRYEIDTPAFIEWLTARETGISIEELRRQELDEEIKARERDAARWRIVEAEFRNRRLAATVETLTAELAALRREVQSLKRRKAK